MDIKLTLAQPSDTKLIHQMKVKTFTPLLKIYKDTNHSPANESMEKAFIRIQQPFTDYYIIEADSKPVGAIRIIREYENTCVISPLFVLPEYQNMGIAQTAMAMVESMYPDRKRWVLDTILEEKGNCHLYEKMGYAQKGIIEKVNSAMTLVEYEKMI